MDETDDRKAYDREAYDRETDEREADDGCDVAWWVGPVRASLDQAIVPLSSHRPDDGRAQRGRGGVRGEDEMRRSPWPGRM